MCDKIGIKHEHIIMYHRPVYTKYYSVYCCMESPDKCEEKKLDFGTDWWFAIDREKNTEGIYINCPEKGSYKNFIELPASYKKSKEKKKLLKMKPPKDRVFYKANYFEDNREIKLQNE